MPGKPNIIFILADQWRGDCLSITGHPVLKTPTLDMLGSRGAVFTRAYTPCPSCVAARACIFTGQSPSTVGRLGYRDCVPWRYPTSLMTELAAGGYQCHCVGKTHFYPQRFHFGFHSMESYEAVQNHDGDFVNDYHQWLVEQPGGPWNELNSGVDFNSWVAAPSTLPEHLHCNSWTVTRSIEFMRRRDPTRPFFLNVSFHRPHAPLDPPSQYFHMYDDAELPPVPMGDWAQEYDKPTQDVNASSGRISQRQLDCMRRAYWGQISHIDMQLNRLLIYLRMAKLAQNTVIVFASDHGELLGDHCLYRKTQAFEGSARIPLIVAAPPSMAHMNNLRSDRPVSLIDLMPTMLDMAGLPIPKNVEGSSLVGLMRGQRPAWREYVHGEHTLRATHGGMQYLAGERYKYIWYTRSGTELLFDLIEDPNECVNLAAKPQHSGLVAEWRSKLARELGTRPQDGLSDGKKLIPGTVLPDVRPELLEPFYDNEGRPRPGNLVSP